MFCYFLVSYVQKYFLKSSKTTKLSLPILLIFLKKFYLNTPIYKILYLLNKNSYKIFILNKFSYLYYLNLLILFFKSQKIHLKIIYSSIYPNLSSPITISKNLNSIQLKFVYNKNYMFFVFLSFVSSLLSYFFKIFNLKKLVLNNSTFIKNFNLFSQVSSKLKLLF